MVNVRRIFYVTSHFHVLKGLAFVPWGLYYLAGSVFAATQPALDNVTLLIILFSGLLLVALAQLPLARYYQRTLGTVGEPVQKRHTLADSATRRRRIWLWSGFIVISALVGLLAVWGTPQFDPQYSAMFINRLLCTIVACLLFLTLWLQERLEEGYGHIPLWPFAAYLIFTFEPPAFLRPPSATIILESILIGLFFICGGVYNHLLLTRSLQKQDKVRNYVTRI